MAKEFNIPGLKESIKEVNDLTTLTKDLAKELLDVATNAEKVMQSFKSDGLKGFVDLLKKSNETQKDAVEIADKLEKANLKKEEAIQRSAEKTRLAEIKIQQDREKAFDKFESQLKKEEAARNRQMLLDEKQNRAYNQMAASLNNVRHSAQDTLASMFKLEQQGQKNTKEYRDLEIQSRALVHQTGILDKGIKEIDATLGQHQRKVGQYENALSGLHPIFGRVDSGLQSMGTSLSELAASPDPFSSITSGIMGFGKAALTFMLSPVGLMITALGGLFYLISANKDTVIQFNSGLLDVGKTTGLADQELSEFGDQIVELSRKLKTVGTEALMDYAGVAGQLGVSGTKNLLAFTETLAKLEIASNINGEEGAANIARLLTLTDDGVENVQQFGDEIVALGNKFASTEREILENATAIAQNTGQYEFGRQSVLAYATATNSVGIEAELTGSTIGRTLGLMEKSFRKGGKEAEVFAKLAGTSVKELKKEFANDAAGSFNKFITGLNGIYEAGGSVNAQLEKLGIDAIRDQRVIASLATGGYGTLAAALSEVTKAGGSLDKEFETASTKLANQFSRIGISWDNLVLSFESGDGILAKTAAFLAGGFADLLETVTVVINELSIAWNVLGETFDAFLPKAEKTSKSVSLFQLNLLLLKLALKAVAEIFAVSLPNGLNNAKMGFDVLKNSASQFAQFVMTVFPEVKKYILDAINPMATANISGFDKAIDNFRNKLASSNSKIIKDTQEANRINKANFDKRYADEGKSQADAAAAAAAAKAKGAEEEVEIEEDAQKKIDAARKKSAEIAIKAMKHTLDNLIATYDQAAHLDSENVAHVQAISDMKIAIADAEMRKNLIGITKGSMDEKEIISANAQEVEKIQKEKAKALENIIKDRAKFEMQLYDLHNKSLLDGARELTDLLVEEERNRLQKTLEVKKAAMREELGIEKDMTDARLQELSRSEEGRKLLNGNQIKYIQFVEKETISTNKEIRKNDSNLLAFKLQSMEEEMDSSQNKFKSLRKGAVSNQIYEIQLMDAKLKKQRKLWQEEEKMLKEQGKDHSEASKKIQQIDEISAENKAALDNYVADVKKDNLEKGLDLALQIFGEESEIGKAIAIAKITIDTIQKSTEAFSTAFVLESNPITAALAPNAYLQGALIIASGAAQAAKVAGFFEEGTTNAPYTGPAVVDEKGAEIHADRHGRIKSFGTDTGARLTNIVQGDVIVPADITAVIKSSLFSNYKIKGEAAGSIDYDKIGSQFGKHAEKIVQAIKGKRSSNVHISVHKDASSEVSLKGKKV